MTDRPTADAGKEEHLAEYIRWLGEAPTSLRSDPQPWNPQGIYLAPVLGDLVESVLGERPQAGFWEWVLPVDDGPAERRRLGWVLLSAHLLWHPELRSPDRRRPEAASLVELWTEELRKLSQAAPWESIDDDLERREELIRRVFRACSWPIPGESPAESEDRLVQLDSVERARLVKEASEREKRRRALAEELARKAAEEAAARYSPE